MPRFLKNRNLYALGALSITVAALGTGLFLARQAMAQEPAKSSLTQSPVNAATEWKDFLHAPSSDCMECHAAPTPRWIGQGSTDFVLMTESGIWRAYDKHAQAYAVLKGTRGKQMSKLLFGKEDAVLDPKNGCLSCHAMHNLSEANVAKGGKALSLEDGVSCTGCHGPSTKTTGGGWLGDHQQPNWRENTPKSKFDKGMRDLRDPIIRAELCMSCHIGNAQENKVVTHAMMAAGHPPLPAIELATFSKNEPQHWRDVGDVPFLKANKTKAPFQKNYDLENLDFAQTRTALVGNVIAVRETLQLVVDRAKFDAPNPLSRFPELAMPGEAGGSNKPGDRWPEIAMAHSDCFSCHHDLKYPGYRQSRGFGYYVPGTAAVRVVPGRPVVRTWPIASLVPGLVLTGKTDPAELRNLLDKLARATNERPFGDPEKVAGAAQELIKWCNARAVELHSVKLTKENVRKMIADTVAIYDADNSSTLLDFESARQLASTLRVALTEAGMDREVNAILKKFDRTLNLSPYFTRDDRLNVLKGVIWKAANPDAPLDPKYNAAFDVFNNYLARAVKGPIEQKEQEALIRNDFLNTLKQVFPDRFNKALIDKSDELQILGDKEAEQMLKAVQEYDAKAFLADLKALGAGLK